MKNLIIIFFGLLLTSCSMVLEPEVVKLSDLTFPESLLQPTEVSNKILDNLGEIIKSSYTDFEKQYFPQAIEVTPYQKLKLFKTIAEKDYYTYVSDIENFGIEDKWQLLENFLLSKKGDCEEISASFTWLAYLMLGDNSPYVLVNSYTSNGNRHMWVKNIYNPNDTFNKTGTETKDIYQITIKQYLAIAYNLDNDFNIDIFINNK